MWALPHVPCSRFSFIDTFSYACEIGPMRLVLAIAAAAACAATPVFAQDRGFEAEALRPATNLTTNYLATSSARLVGRGSLFAGALFSYASNPILVRDTASLAPPYRPVNGRVVTDRSVLHVLATYGVFDWLEVGADLPLVLRQEGQRLSGLAHPDAVRSSFGLGDVRLVTKAQVLWIEQGLGGHAIGVATSFDLDLPTGDRDRFQGGGLKLAPRAILEWVTPFGLRVAGNLGYLWRAESTDILGLDVADEVLWSAGVDVPLLASLGPLDRLGLVAEVDGSMAVEAIGGIKASGFGAQLVAGAGVGLIDEPKTPDWRMFVALTYGIGAPPSPTARVDDPPPAQPTDGDEDGDGIADADDACRKLAEDFDGHEDEDGCPDVDDDGDGIVDALDRCPNVPEDRDGFEDGDGCPDEDDDKDGIADAVDACRTDPEDIDGDRDEDGCPDFDQPLAVDVVVYFDSDSTRIGPRDHYPLDRVAQTLRSAPRGVHVWVEGHADDTGSSNHNRDLSKERADHVRNYLIGRGVAGDQLTAIGWGETRNVRDNASDDGRGTNRRVEFRASPRSRPPDEPLHVPTTDTSTKAQSR